MKNILVIFSKNYPTKFSWVEKMDNGTMKIMQWPLCSGSKYKKSRLLLSQSQRKNSQVFGHLLKNGHPRTLSEKKNSNEFLREIFFERNIEKYKLYNK
jgi:hypothetical protein